MSTVDANRVIVTEARSSACATFANALVALVGLRIATEEDTVAGLTVTFAFVLAVVAIVTFAMFANHIIHSMRASALIQRIAAETREAIEPLPAARRTGARGEFSAGAAGRAQPDRHVRPPRRLR